jgi:hypothetical protein
MSHNKISHRRPHTLLVTSTKVMVYPPEDEMCNHNPQLDDTNTRKPEELKTDTLQKKLHSNKNIMLTF